MRYVRYGEPGQEKPGVLDGDGGLRDLSGVVEDLAGAVLAELPRVAPERLALVPGTPRLGPPVAGVGKYIGIGLNFSDHAAEAGMKPPEEPILFMKATSAICGPDDDIRLPRGAEHGDWEVELGIVIGKPAKYVSEARALDHVAGYVLLNDVSERRNQTKRSGQWTKGKSSDTFGPIGPWLVTPDEVGDPQALDMWLDLNGERMQTGSTAAMIFPCATLIAYLSELMTLHPGDVIATGTPPGVGMGMDPPRHLRPGDRLRLGITGLGEQNARVTRDE